MDNFPTMLSHLKNYNSFVKTTVINSPPLIDSLDPGFTEAMQKRTVPKTDPVTSLEDLRLRPDREDPYWSFKPFDRFEDAQHLYTSS